MTSHNCTSGQSHRFSRLWLAACLLFCDVTAANVVSNNNSNNNSSNNGIVSLKLNPRHAELERRRKERQRNLSASDAEQIQQQQQQENDNDNEEQYRRREDAVQVGALFEGYGTHYIDLWCGSPPQRQTVIVDTGSGVTAFPCSGCTDCGVPDYHIDRLFMEEESKTFRESTCSAKSDCIMSRSNCENGGCKIGMSYAEGSRWNAHEAVDLCYVAGPHETPLVSDITDGKVEAAIAIAAAATEDDAMDPRHAADLAFDMTFGCQTVATNLFKTQLADGIMGMSNQPSTFWSQMYRAGNMGDHQQFSLCFSRPPEITKEGTEAGAMTLGGTDTRLHKTPMVYTPHFEKGRSSFFSVKVRKFMLRDGQYGESAKSTDINPNKGVVTLDLDEGTLNRGGIIVDSGTTDTYWASGIAKEYKKVFQKLSGHAHHNQGMTLTEDDIKKFPTMLLQLYSDDITNDHVDDKYKTPGLAGAMDPQHPSDVILAIPPSHYLEYNPDKNTYTNRFYPTERSGSVLGANAMMGHDVFFDMDQLRIGWAESDCDYTKTVQDLGYDFEITGKLKKHPEKVDHRTSFNKHSDKHNNNDNNNVCGDITSGNTCQKTEGCTWGWGKCSVKSEGVATDSPTYFPTFVPTQSDDESSSDDDDDESSSGGGASNIVDMDALREQANAHQTELLVTILVTLSLLLCCCYCLCCRRGGINSSTNKKYKTSLDVSTIEMTTNGGGGFQDEPESFDDDDDDEDYDDDDDDHKSSNGSRSSSQFRDHPDSEPEFDGDFA